MKIKLLLLSSIYTLFIGCGGSGGADNAVNSTGTVSIAGTTINGQTLTATVEDGNGLTDVTITYSWSTVNPNDDDNDRSIVIDGETNNTLVLTEDQIGNTIIVTASYTDADSFQERHTSTRTATVSDINVNGSVTISGDAAVGRRLTAMVVDANGISGTITYQWAAGGNNIANANASTYVITAGELGETLTVTATYTDDQGFDAIVSSASTVAVAPAPPDAPGTLTISGTAGVGETLTANLTDADGITAQASYQWAASGTDIPSATASTLLLTNSQVGQTITVTATYTDDGSTTSTLTSSATAAVAAAAMNIEGTIAITGTLEVGELLSSNITDPNGVSGSVTYTWSGNGSAIASATDATFTLTTDQRGQTITVSAQYTDDNSFSESIDSAATGQVFSFIVTGESSLTTALASAVDGDWIGLDSAGSDDYTDMAEIVFAADNLNITKTMASTAVISGATCVVLSGNGIKMDSLTFDNLSLIASSQCDSNGDSSVYLAGDNITLSNNDFTGQAANPGASTYNWISVRGSQNIIERNRFSDKGENGTRANLKGSVISVFTSDSAIISEPHIIRYNLFEEIGTPGPDTSTSRNSSAYAIQLGRSTGRDSLDNGFNRVQYNLFKKVNFDRRVMRVQSNANTIDHNTMLDSSGMIALEDGGENEVTNNIIINATGDNPDDGGISYSAFGHIITNNYIAGLRTTSNERGGLLANSAVLENGASDSTGNSSRPITAVTVENNTILNTREAIEFSDRSCNPSRRFIVDFSSNLVANGEDDGVSEGKVAGQLGNGTNTSRAAIHDDCPLDPSSDFDNNHIYSGTFTSSGSTTFFTDFASASGNIGMSGTNELADVIIEPSSGLLIGQGADAGIGADTTQLELLDEMMVGPGSTWLPPGL